MIDDPFFKLSGGSDWNAFIGRQGSFANYADGYIEAALDLANMILSDRRYIQRDTLVLPILYNARHSIELHLKLIIGELVKVGILHSGHIPNHDIASHLQHLIDCRIPDLTFRSLLYDLQPYIASLAKVDDDGQELRYFTNRDGKRSLKDRSLVNIVVIRDSLVVLKETLDNFKYRTAELCEEFRTGTHTKHLSRKDLFEIAGMLPKREQWSDPKFDECKTIIKEQFEIGSGEFSLALQIMQQKRQLKAVLGVETPLAHLSDEKAIFLVKKWQLFHPPRKSDDLGMDYFRRDFDALRRDREHEKEALNDILATLSIDEIADAETIFYLSRNRDFSESYEDDLDVKKKEYRASGDFRMETYNLMQKTNFLEDFTSGVQKLGRLALAASLKNL
ncbi:hypothetical protein HFO55_01445 [Rhizobium leguminosarum]|uniref:hypothetical protein n=1 Tax=Rhizobium leguminosarum TaxID=384 RepID=UPI001C937C40|nr:hypothetical protein [Rhizobium leguminosarum]MBY5565926.1 hypothetical protein [Rhizobium leguminosarum]MBY5573094.1 hypothetical protein [Rhizobium leguminosarum]